MPAPAIDQAIRAPTTPVSCANRRGRENTPAPTIDPTTMAVSVRKLSFCTDEDEGAVSVVAICSPSTPVRGPGRDDRPGGVGDSEHDQYDRADREESHRPPGWSPPARR